MYTFMDQMAALYTCLLNLLNLACSVFSMFLSSALYLALCSMSLSTVSVVFLYKGIPEIR